MTQEPTSQTPNPPLMEGDSIDLIALLKSLWQSRFFILKVTILFFVIGLLVAFLSPVSYTATSSFVPQTSESKSAGSLGGLAALAGINLNAGTGGADIPTTLYPKLVASVPFRKDILDTPIQLGKETLSYKDYLDRKKPSGLALLNKYTIGLPGLILPSFKREANLQLALDSTELIELSDEDYSLYQSLSSVISIETIEEEGYVSLAVVDEDPQVAAQVAKSTELALQKRIIEYKVENSRALFEFTEKQFLLKQQEVYELQDKLAYFLDRNRSIFSAQIESQKQRLESQYNLANTVYNELAKQKEQASIQLSKDTPIFTVIEPVMVPKEKSGQKRGILLAIYTFLGLVLSAGYVLVKKPIQAIRKEIMA
jgi:uncharacterized protein involved in exopolysaccharide biosynthesis